MKLLPHREVLLGPNFRLKEATTLHAGTRNPARRKSGSYKVRIKSARAHWATWEVGCTHDGV